MRRALLLVCVLSLASVVMLCPAAARSPVSEVAGGVICPCPDDCMRVLGDCVCSYSDDYRAEIDSMLNTGLEGPDAKEAFLARYGERFRASPRFEGGGLLLWVLPPVFILAGLVALVGAMGRWRSVSVTGTERRETSTAPRAISQFEEELKSFDA